MPGHQSTVIAPNRAVALFGGAIGLELTVALVVDVLAVACLGSWLKEWRHDEGGRVFFTLLTAVALLLAVVFSVDVIRIFTGG